MHNSQSTPPRNNQQTKLIPVVIRIKEAYVLWLDCYRKIPKPERYTLGQHIDELFIASIEAAVQAGFLSGSEKQPYVKLAIRKVDTLKVLLMILWETKSMETKKYADLSIILDEVGRMLGGWSGQLNKTQPRT